MRSQKRSNPRPFKKNGRHYLQLSLRARGNIQLSIIKSLSFSREKRAASFLVSSFTLPHMYNRVGSQRKKSLSLSGTSARKSLLQRAVPRNMNPRYGNERSRVSPGSAAAADCTKTPVFTRYLSPAILCTAANKERSACEGR